jgi:hypothetical protein
VQLGLPLGSFRGEEWLGFINSFTREEVAVHHGER